MSDKPAKALQIDALLTDGMYRIVERYCGGAWGALPQVWSVTAEEISAEARRRGLECYISSGRPRFDGFKIDQVHGGYEVYYLERGTRSSVVRHPDLESAFSAWLQNTLRAHELG